jgi:hypothetical protein
MMPSQLVLRPETRFVFATAGGPTAPLLERVSPATLRWGGVLKVAVHERAVAGVRDAIVHHAALAVPAEVTAAMDRLTLAARVRMTWLAHRLDETVAALTAAGVPVMLLKGAGVGSTAYRSIAERQMGDLDLLVPADAAEAARAAALGCDWLPTDHEDRKAFYAGHYHLPPLRDRKAPDLWLELHTGLLPAGNPFALDADAIWSAARPVAGSAAVVPSPVHQVLHLCTHFGWSHAMSQGAWQAFRDLRQLVAQEAFVWAEVVAEARRANAASVCYWTFALARAAGGVAVPPEVLAELRPRRSDAVLAALGRHLGLLMDPLATPCPSRSLSRRLWRSALRDDLAGRKAILPWEREELFDLPGERAPDPSVRAWAGRHILGAGDYLRYARAVTRGN